MLYCTMSAIVKGSNTIISRSRVGVVGRGRNKSVCAGQPSQCRGIGDLPGRLQQRLATRGLGWVPMALAITSPQTLLLTTYKQLSLGP